MVYQSSKWSGGVTVGSKNEKEGREEVESTDFYGWISAL